MKRFSSTTYFTRRFAVAGAAMGLAICSGAQASPVIGQKDDFQSGIQNWQNGHSSSADTVVPNGIGGAGDSFLEIQSGGTNTPRLLTFNRTQWSGDFFDAGVTGVSMDLKNMDPGTTTLSIRIGLRQGTGGSATPGYVTSTAFSLPADGSWHHATFAINAASLTAVNSPTAPLSTFLTSVAEFRILDSTFSSGPTLEGDAITSGFGVDNITATPEPATLGMLGLAAGATLTRRRRY